MLGPVTVYFVRAFSHSKTLSINVFLTLKKTQNVNSIFKHKRKHHFSVFFSHNKFICMHGAWTFLQYDQTYVRFLLFIFTDISSMIIMIIIMFIAISAKKQISARSSHGPNLWQPGVEMGKGETGQRNWKTTGGHAKTNCLEKKDMFAELLSVSLLIFFINNITITNLLRKTSSVPYAIFYFWIYFKAVCHLVKHGVVKCFMVYNL